MKAFIDVCAYRDATRQNLTNPKKIEDSKALKKIVVYAMNESIELFLSTNNYFEEWKAFKNIETINSRNFWGDSVKHWNQHIGFNGRLAFDDTLKKLEGDRINFFEKKLQELKNKINNPKLSTDLSIIINGEYFAIPFFITTDYKLLGAINRYKSEFSINVLRPIEFLKIIQNI